MCLNNLLLSEISRRKLRVVKELLNCRLSPSGRSAYQICPLLTGISLIRRISLYYYLVAITYSFVLDAILFEILWIGSFLLPLDGY